MKPPRRPRLLPPLLCLLTAVALSTWNEVGRPAASEPPSAPGDSLPSATADVVSSAAQNPMTPPAAPAPAAADAGPARSRLRALNWKDQLLDGEPVSILTGQVVIDRDTLVVHCDTAYCYRQRDFFDLRGEVEVRQRGAVVTSRRALHWRAEGATDFLGGVRVEEGALLGTAVRAEARQDGDLMRLIGSARLIAPEYTVWADTIARFAALDAGEAWGAVRIVDASSQTLVTGRHALFPAEGVAAVVDQDPVLTASDAGEEPLIARARLMRFYRDPQRVVMQDSVRITQGRSLARADSAEAFGRELLVLRGRPRVRDGDRSEMTAQEIELHYLQGQLQRVRLHGAALVEDSAPDSLAALYPGLPPLDVLEGDTIVVEFADGEARRSTVHGGARSLYVPTDPVDEIAYNDVRGDTIVIDFLHGRVDRVEVRGNMSGDWWFADLAKLAADAAAAADTAAAAADDTLRPDGGFAARREQVAYRGRAVVFQVPARRIQIDGDAELTYGTMTLEARQVRLDVVSKELIAEGDPLLDDKGQKMVGDRMGYNFAHRTGAVSDGTTEFDQYYYAGRHVRRYADGELRIRSGRMTSCDIDRPHYHFWADKMKIQLEKRVVAKPVVMKIGEVPVFAIPFYFKSLESGRRSGILFPSFNFGWSQREGRYIRDFGYYWATNDYTDLTFQGDYNERRELTFRIGNRYVKRYGFNGNADYSRRMSLSGPEVREWQLRWSHNHDRLLDEYTFRTSVQMASRTLSSNDLNADVGRDVVSGQLRSTMLLSRNWNAVSATLNFSRDEQVNAEDDDPATDNLIWTQSFPQLSLSFRRLALRGAPGRGQRGSFLGDLLRNTYFNHSYAAGQTRQQRELTRQRTDVARGEASLEVRPPRLGFLNLSAGARGRQSWQRITREGELYGTLIDTTSAPPDTFGVFTSFRHVDESTSPALSFNASAVTTLYGIFPLHLGRLSALRHTFTASAGYSLTPSLGAKQRRSESYGFSVGNRFDVKYLQAAPGDSAAKVEKLDGLLDWRLSGSYTPAAPADRRWSEITSDVAIKPGRSRNLNFKVGNTIDPYALKIVSTRLTYGLNLDGRIDTGGEVAAPIAHRDPRLERLAAGADTTAATDTLAAAVAPEADLDFGFAGALRPPPGDDSKDPTAGGRYLPWSLSSSISFSKNNQTGLASARASLAVAATLTRNWKMRYQAAFDLEAGTITRQSWDLQRDLHCWALEFSRVVSAVDQQFGFRLYLKSIPSVEVTRGKRDLTGTLSGLGGGGFF